MACGGPQLELSICPVYAVAQAGVQAALSQDQPHVFPGKVEARFPGSGGWGRLLTPHVAYGLLLIPALPGASERTDSSCSSPEGLPRPSRATVLKPEPSCVFGPIPHVLVLSA